MNADPGMRGTRLFCLFALSCTILLSACEASDEPVPEVGEAASLVDEPQTMDGKVYAGYQGWFAAKGDGTRNGFDNYQAPFEGGLAFKPGAAAIDLWPDLSEFDEDELYETPFKHADGSTAHVFSSANPKTVDRHFQWMKEYGIDGVFLQRFAWMLNKDNALRHRNHVLQNVRQSAANHGREWALMYDLTSVDDAHIEKYVYDDIKKIIDDGDPRQSSSYIHHEGKPVIAIWGVGFSDGRGYSLEACMKLVRFLKDDPTYGGNAVMLGVPYYWKEKERDAVRDPLFHEILKAGDIVSPWAVGRFGSLEDAEHKVYQQVKTDMKWTQSNDTDYMPVIFPGFSWHNLKKAHGQEAKLDHIPRHGGEFLWRQATAAKRGGAKTIYIAMFDEYNEATAIMKATNNPPVGDSKFLTYKDVPSDHYLWLSGRIGALLRGEIDAEAPLPQRNP